MTEDLQTEAAPKVGAMAPVVKGGRRKPGIVIDPGFAEWFQRARLNLGLTKDEMAKRAHLSPDTISEFEKGEKTGKPIMIGTFVGIADAFNMDLAYVLTKAGVRLGTSGVNIARLNRVEAAADAFARAETQTRRTLAEAMFALEHREDLTDEEVARLVGQLGRSLGHVDLLAERLHAMGFSTTVRPMFGTGSRNRAWTPEEERYVRENPSLSLKDLADELGRSEDGVRAKRMKLLPSNNNHPGGHDE